MPAHPSDFAIAGIFLAIAVSSCGNSGPPADAGVGDVGAIAVEGSVTLIEGPFACPAISSFSINPAALASSEVARLEAVTVGPEPSTVRWSASSGSEAQFSDPTSLDTSFRCDGSGLVTVTVEVGVAIPNLGNVCSGLPNTTYSGTIDCEAAPARDW